LQRYSTSTIRKKEGGLSSPHQCNRQGETTCIEEKMSGLSGTRSDDFISAAKARAEAALKDNQPKLTKLENAFRHAALRRSAQAARRAGMGKPMIH